MFRSNTITDTVLMIRPNNFGYNQETAETNLFQNPETGEDNNQIKINALKEFDAMVDKLRGLDIEVLVMEDTDTPVKPDSVFPNNWFSTHSDGKIISYPMRAVSRRAERREDIIDQLSEDYSYEKRYAFEYLENDNQFLEGTGSMIIDRDNKIIYACLSSRTSIEALEKCAVLLGYRKLIFHAFDKHMNEIYHTNVMMSLGIDFAVVCMESIRDEVERKELRQELTNSNKLIIEITLDQMHSFAGNMLQLYRKSGHPVLIMSDSAFKSLNWNQLDQIRSKTEISNIAVPFIESCSGGSVRCMMAEIFKSF